MVTITPPDLTATAGIPSQGSDTIAVTPEGFVTGDHPRIFTEDMTFAYSQDIPARTPVGFDANNDLVPATSGASSAVAASGVLTFSGTGTDDDTVTIGTTVYTLKTALTGAANEVKIGASAAATATNLIAAINGGAGIGVTYGTGTVPHPSVTARSNGSGIVGLTANAAGLAGNSIATTESGTGTSFGAATLTGGLDGAGVQAIGLTVVRVVSAASGTKTAAPVYRGGCFNPALVNWPASYDTTAEKLAAFRGAPSPTSIIMRPVSSGSITLP